MSTLELPVPETQSGVYARYVVRRYVRLAGWTVGAALIAVWALLFRPQFLGGPAAYVMVSGMSMEPTLHTGDLVIAHRRDHYAVGDAVVYRVPKGEAGAGAMIIHRIVGGSAASGWVVQGDNKDIPDLWRPKGGDLVGSAWVRVPGAGRLLAYATSPLWLATISTLLAFLIGLPGAAVEAVESRSRRRRRWPAGRITAVAAAAMAAVLPLLRKDAPLAVAPKPPLAGPVSHRLALPSASARTEPWGEAAWTARDLYGRPGA
jgi:signal peptidase